MPVEEWEVFQMGLTCSQCASTFVRQDPPDNDKTMVYGVGVLEHLHPVFPEQLITSPGGGKRRNKGEKNPTTLNDSLLQIGTIRGFYIHNLI